MSMKRKRSILSVKDKQTILSRLDKGDKGTALALEFGISKQQVSDIRKNKEKILKFTESLETSEGLLVSCHEKSAPGFKKAKDPLTVLGCTNATGTHELKPR